MARPSTSYGLTEFKVNEVINEVFNNDIIRQHSLCDDSDFVDGYTQLVTPRT
jgi:hypothetical protein